MEGGHALIIERHSTTYKDVQYDAEAPDVDLGACIYLGIQELRRSKVERAAEGREVLCGIVEVRETEVDNLDIPCLRDEDVLDFEVYETLW